MVVAAKDKWLDNFWIVEEYERGDLIGSTSEEDKQRRAPIYLKVVDQLVDRWMGQIEGALETTPDARRSVTYRVLEPGHLVRWLKLNDDLPDKEFKSLSHVQVGMIFERALKQLRPRLEAFSDEKRLDTTFTKRFRTHEHGKHACDERITFVSLLGWSMQFSTKCNHETPTWCDRVARTFKRLVSRLRYAEAVHAIYENYYWHASYRLKVDRLPLPG